MGIRCCFGLRPDEQDLVVSSGHAACLLLGLQGCPTGIPGAGNSARILWRDLEQCQGRGGLTPNLLAGLAVSARKTEGLEKDRVARFEYLLCAVADLLALTEAVEAVTDPVVADD